MKNVISVVLFLSIITMTFLCIRVYSINVNYEDDRNAYSKESGLLEKTDTINRYNTDRKSIFSDPSSFGAEMGESLAIGFFNALLFLPILIVIAISRKIKKRKAKINDQLNTEKGDTTKINKFVSESATLKDKEISSFNKKIDYSCVESNTLGVCEKCKREPCKLFVVSIIIDDRVQSKKLCHSCSAQTIKRIKQLQQSTEAR